MKLNNKIRKGQSLPLNTIVIAMLVIIVLLVIIVFFTSSVSKSGDTISKNSATACAMSNPVITTLGYKEVKSVKINNKGKPITTDEVNGYQKISSVPIERNNDGNFSCYGKK